MEVEQEKKMQKSLMDARVRQKITIWALTLWREKRMGE